MTAGRNFFCFKTHGKFQPRTARALFSFSRYRLNRLSLRGFLWKIVVLPQPAWWVVGRNTALRSQRLGRPCSSPLTSPHLPHLTLNPGRRAPVRFCCFCCSRRHFSPAPALASSLAPATAPLPPRPKPLCASIPRGPEVQRRVVCSLREQKGGEYELALTIISTSRKRFIMNRETSQVMDVSLSK